MMKRVRIASGEHAGRYVGPNIGGGLITNQELLKNREVKVPGTEYSLYAQEGMATQFLDAASVRAELRALGFTTELVAVTYTVRLCKKGKEFKSIPMVDDGHAQPTKGAIIDTDKKVSGVISNKSSEIVVDVEEMQ
jgi:hypothetical protein